MKVLFCTDGSQISYQAIQNFCRWMNSYVVDMLCVIDWSFMSDAVSMLDSEIMNYCTNSADIILDYAENHLSELGISVGDKIKMCGSTIDCIIDTLQNNVYDFVILGSHGKKGIQKWLGSVSQEVASGANVSTYISKENNLCNKVVFAVDSTVLSPRFIKKALESISLKDKNISLVTVYELPDYLFLEGVVESYWMSEIVRKQELAAKILLNEFENIFNAYCYSVSNKVVLNGNPSVELIKYLEKQEIDLIVCGMRDRVNLPKFLLNSVSKRILESTKSDVLIIRL